jgi:hypothetical protein
MTDFNEFCAFLKVTPDERRKLAQHLATLRHAATMRLAEPPPTHRPNRRMKHERLRGR